MYQNVFKYDEIKRAEHMAVRTTAGWYRFTHQVMEVSGPDAASVLDSLYTAPVSGLKIGKNKYNLMLDQKGLIKDDVVIIRRGEDKFWISNLNLFLVYGTLGAVAQTGARIQFYPVTTQYEMYSVQGPKSRDILNALLDKPVDELKFFTMEDNNFEGVPVLINRAGFTGEKLGYEIYIAPEHAARLATKLGETAARFGGREVKELQLMCWTLPTEKGLLLCRDMLDVTPFDVGYDRYVNWDHEFTGKAALEQNKEAHWELLGFTLDQDDAFIPSKHLGGAGAKVFLGDEEIGRVSKFVYSYVLEKNIGYVLVEKGRVHAGDHVILRHNESYDAVICDRVFC